MIWEAFYPVIAALFAPVLYLLVAVYDRLYVWWYSFRACKARLYLRRFFLGSRVDTSVIWFGVPPRYGRPAPRRVEAARRGDARQSAAGAGTNSLPAADCPVIALMPIPRSGETAPFIEETAMREPELPPPAGDWDNPTCTDALPMALVDLVSVLNQIGHRLPSLIGALEKLRDAIPGFARDALLGEMPLGRWAAMVALLDEPASILGDLVILCRQQADRPARIKAAPNGQAGQR